MKLSLDVICDYLDSSYRAVLLGSERQWVYSRPLPYDAGFSLEPNTLYIAYRIDIPAVLPSGVALITVGGDIPDVVPGSGIQILHIPGIISLTEVMTRIFKIFDELDMWEQQLRDELESYPEINMVRLLQIGADQLGNPVSIYNYKLDKLFTCSPISLHTTCELKSGEQKSLSIDEWEAVNRVCQTERKIQESFLSTIPINGISAYCHNFFSLGNFIGCVNLLNKYRDFRKK